VAAFAYQRSDQTEEREDDHMCRENADSGSGNVLLSIVDVLEIQQTINNQKLQTKELKDKLYQVQSAFKRCLFRLENIRDNNDLVETYTGFPDYATL